MVSIYERETTFKSQVTWTSGSTNVDPSGNMSFLEVYDPNDNRIINTSGQKSDTGVYYYYISTQSSDDLGLYRIRWRALFNYNAPWNFSPSYDTEVVQIVKVKQG